MSWTLIEHQALTSSVASVTLGSGGTIPQTYKTLKLVVSARGSANRAGNGYYYYVYPNNASTNLTTRYLVGNGAATSSGSTAPAFVYMSASDDTASTFSNDSIEFPNYAGSTNKPYSIDSVNENNATTANQVLEAGLWSQTSAITSIVLTPGGGNFVSGSTFTLYGLA